MRIGLIGVGVLAVATAFLGLGSCTVIDTGNVGVRTTFGQISSSEVLPGTTIKPPMFTSIDHYNVRETTIDLNNLTPKAKDNLSLDDLDISILYEVNSAKVADTAIRFSGQSPWNDDLNSYQPGQGIVVRQARGAVYSAVSNMDSLTIHQRREALANAVRADLQKQLDLVAPGTFKINNVVVRSVTTDPSIEQSIRNAVIAQKQLEQRAVQERIAQADARIAVTRAEGEAKANNVVSQSLTDSVLRQKQIEALSAFARNGNSTVVLPSGATPLVQVK